MNLIFFSSKPYDRMFFELHNQHYGFTLQFQESALNISTCNLAKEADVVCVFVNDKLDREVIEELSRLGVKLIALRCAGFNNVDIQAALEFNIPVVRVPAYSPHAVAEHAIAMILTLNRKTHKAYNRIREQDFSLNGLLGFDLYGKTVGVVGTGNIGKVFCQIMKGFGCQVLATDPNENSMVREMGISYHSFEELLPQCDILSLHCPLHEASKHMINSNTISLMKDHIMIINTSRGGLIDTPAVIKGLKSGKIGSLGIDVYEQEENIFFQDLSDTIIQDDVIARLISFPNVLITAHQGFFTKEALNQIAETTLQSVSCLEKGDKLTHKITLDS